MLEPIQKGLYPLSMNKPTRSPSPVASLFKTRRKALKLSQVALADRVRELLGPDETFSQQTYAAFEAGNTQNTRFALQIAQVPENYNDENKSKRQMEFYFDVDAAANNHEGRSLKAERQTKKLSKKELKQFKEKRKKRKEEKRKAWLKD